MDGGARQRDALLPATRQRARELLPAVGEPRAREHRVDPRAPGSQGHAVDARIEGEVLEDGEVLVEAEALGHVADALLDALGLPHDVAARDGPAAAGGIEDAAEHPDEGGLAGAVRAEDAEDLPAADVERDVAHGDELAEAARQVRRVDDGRLRGGGARRLGVHLSTCANAGTPE